jgi:predicted metal-dependent hydrolase
VPEPYGKKKGRRRRKKMRKNRPDFDMPMPLPTAPVKKFSVKKTAAIAKMVAAQQIALKQAKNAKTQMEYFRKKLTSNPGHQSETVFGSAVAEVLFARSQDKYHAAKWFAAANSIGRRYQRLTKLIARRKR